MKSKIISFIITLAIVVPVAVILKMNEVSGWLYFVSIVGAYIIAEIITKAISKNKDNENYILHV